MIMQTKPVLASDQVFGDGLHVLIVHKHRVIIARLTHWLAVPYNTFNRFILYKPLLFVYKYRFIAEWYTPYISLFQEPILISIIARIFKL